MCLGVGVVVVVAAHLLGVIHHHLVVQVLDLIHRADVVQLLDVEIAHPEGLFQLHAILPAHTGHHGGGDNKMILQIHDRVFGQDPHPVQVHEAVLLAVLAHCVHFTVGYGTVKQEFFAGFAVLCFVHVIVGFDHKPFVFVTHRYAPFCSRSRSRKVTYKCCLCWDCTNVQMPFLASHHLIIITHRRHFLKGRNKTGSIRFLCPGTPAVQERPACQESPRRPKLGTAN